MNRIFTWIRNHKFTILVFFLILFRPQILAAIRIHVIKPVEKSLHHHRAKKFQKPAIQCKQHTARRHDGYHFQVAAFIRMASRDDENNDDGCSDGGDCNSDNSEYYQTDTSNDGCADDGSCDSGSDQSSDNYNSNDNSDDGCSDSNDESCASDNSSTYDQAPYDNSDDGCDCSGGGVVGSSSGSVNDHFYNSTVIGRVTTSYYFNLYVTDASGNILIYLARNTSVNGSFPFSWDGYYGQNQFVTGGTYLFVLETAGSPHRSTSKSFTYSSQYGFQVGGTTGIIVDLGL